VNFTMYVSTMIFLRSMNMNLSQRNRREQK